MITDVSLEDSGNYTCEINGPLNSLLGQVTHYLFVRGAILRVALFFFCYVVGIVVLLTLTAFKLITVPP